jgi:hypothetical protein
VISTERGRALARGVGSALRVALLLVGSVQPCRAETGDDDALPWLRIEAAGDHCVDSEALMGQIQHLLDDRPPAHVAARARSSGQGWIIELRHATGQVAQREFPVLPNDCAERMRALALVTALAIEHAVEAPRTLEDEAPPARSALTWSLGLHAGGSLGELPGPAGLLGLDARIERGLWVPLELRAFADVVPSSQARLAGATLVTRQLTLGLGSCLGGRKAAWRIDGCVGAELGTVLGDAARAPQARRDLAGSSALTAALAARWSPRPHLAVTARLEAFVRVWVPSFQLLDAKGEVFAEERLPVAGGRLWLGVSWLSR